MKFFLVVNKAAWHSFNETHSDMPIGTLCHDEVQAQLIRGAVGPEKSVKLQVEIEEVE